MRIVFKNKTDETGLALGTRARARARALTSRFRNCRVGQVILGNGGKLIARSEAERIRENLRASTKARVNLKSVSDTKLPATKHSSFRYVHVCAHTHTRR